MHGVKVLTGCIRQDLYRCMHNKSYIIKIFFITFLYLISQVDILRALYDSAPLEGYDVIGIYNWVVHYDRFHTLLLIVAASVFTGSYCTDFRSNTLKYLILRTGLKKYILSKYIVLCTATAFAYMCGTALYLFILSCFFPYVEKEVPFTSASVYMSFENLPVSEHAFLWTILTLLLVTMSVLALCSVGFYLSFYVEDSLIAVCIPAILYFALIELTLYLPTVFFIQGYSNHIEMFSSNMWINYGGKLAVSTVCILLSAVLSYQKLRSAYEKGTI